MTVTAGANHDIDFNEEIDVPYSGFAGQYFLSANLRHLPEAGPMIKHFQSPIDDTGQPILLDAQQPLPQRIEEEWRLLPATSFDVSDWHEHFRTEGFVWVIPDDTTFPGLFPPNTSLITKNGEPHPWEFVAGPTIASRLDVVFPPIPAGDVLDIHKALLWVGTNSNRIWGDNMLNDGTFFDESRIDVWEFPTPEPTTASLLLIGSLAMLRRRSKP